jgi:hypothetical protein
MIINSWSSQKVNESSEKEGIRHKYDKNPAIYYLRSSNCRFIFFEGNKT